MTTALTPYLDDNNQIRVNAPRPGLGTRNVSADQPRSKPASAPRPPAIRADDDQETAAAKQTVASRMEHLFYRTAHARAQADGTSLQDAMSRVAGEQPELYSDYRALFRGNGK
ncbi:MAG: hypothetical protein ABIG44_14270 [Planctomycetota bacterium]